MSETRKSLLWVFLLLLLNLVANSQQSSRAEAGVNTLILPGNRFSTQTDAGLGGRFTYNFSPNFAIDSELDWSFTNPDLHLPQFGGHTIVGLLGPKAGIRSKHFGTFLKSRLGFMSFGDVLTSAANSGNFTTTRKTHAALDLGAVVEMYPTVRTIVRLDAGVLLVRYGDATPVAIPTPSGTFTIRDAGRIDGPWNISIGAAYRLRTLEQERETFNAPTRWTAGLTYSLLSLERSAETVRDESGIGGWGNWNVNRYFGIDSTIIFFPREVRFIEPQQGGRIVQVLAGFRAGITRDRFGVFAKLRPGAQVYTITVQNQQLQNLAHFANFALDVGAIFEFYTSPHTLLRFDAGNTNIFYRPKVFVGFSGQPLHASGFNNNAIQLTAGFGFRF